MLRLGHARQELFGWNMDRVDVGGMMWCGACFAHTSACTHHPPFTITCERLSTKINRCSLALCAPPVAELSRFVADGLRFSVLLISLSLSLSHPFPSFSHFPIDLAFFLVHCCISLHLLLSVLYNPLLARPHSLPHTRSFHLPWFLWSMSSYFFQNGTHIGRDVLSTLSRPNTFLQAMDVVRITQALRQQHQPGRLHSSRGGNNTLAPADCSSPTSSEPVSFRRGTWENNSNNSNTLTVNTAAALGASSVPAVSASSAASPSSPLSTFFSLSSSPLTTLASFLPSAAAEAATATTSSNTSASPNVGEIESLLLRSMPMFGNLVSRD
ncbi:MAG: hypothetical protein J3Q66DRAFT_333604 [Benniella sp.]|nr:MAG: hypothetical protein J3Q66DRAFT_333604 [Benniella sp.]